MTKWATRFWMLVGSVVPAALLAGCSSESAEPGNAYGPKRCIVDTECQHNGVVFGSGPDPTSFEASRSGVGLTFSCR